MNQHQREIDAGARFEFGANWSRFLTHLDGARIDRAEESLKDMLGIESLSGKRFLDVGSGSGLISLAARRLSARVHSFDYDPSSVNCTAELKRRFFPDDDQWRIESGSVLDPRFLASLGQFDIVYSWGVLHHTGALWQALDNATSLVGPHGRLFIAIYNDQGGASRYWHLVKRTYNSQPLLRWPLLMAHVPYALLPRLVSHTIIARRRSVRGMSLWYDFVDWIGGFPFEVAAPEAVVDFLRSRRFTLEQLRTTKRSGCNEFVFVREGHGTDATPRASYAAAQRGERVAPDPRPPSSRSDA